MNPLVQLEPPFNLLPNMYDFIIKHQMSCGNYGPAIDSFSSQVLCSLLHVKLRTELNTEADLCDLIPYFDMLEKLTSAFSNTVANDKFDINFNGYRSKHEWDRSPLNSSHIIWDLNKKGR